jgi:hypothetical protein
MTLIVTEPVYALLMLEKARIPRSRMFLCRVYRQAKGGEPSWAILHDQTCQKKGIGFRSKKLTLWCNDKDQKHLTNTVLVTGSQGFRALPAVALKTSSRKRQK